MLQLTILALYSSLSPVLDNREHDILVYWINLHASYYDDCVINGLLVLPKLSTRVSLGGG